MLVVVGVITMVVVVALLFYTYVFAPLATKEIESPKQTTLGPLMLTTGKA